MGQCHHRSNVWDVWDGDLTRGRRDRIDCLHIAIQLAPLERDFDTEDTYRRAHDLLNHEPFATQIETFVHWRLHTQLRCC